MLSWVSFWIDIEAVPARITLGLLTILTMTTQASSISERLPRVSYVKAIDVWMAMCLVMVFGALIEYSTVNVLFRKDKASGKRMQSAAAAAANRVPPRSPAGGGVKDKLLMDNDFPEHHPHHHHEPSGLHSRHSSKVSTPTGALPPPQVSPPLPPLPLGRRHPRQLPRAMGPSSGQRLALATRRADSQQMSRGNTIHWRRPSKTPFLSDEFFFLLLSIFIIRITVFMGIPGLNHYQFPMCLKVQSVALHGLFQRLKS